MIIFSKSLHYHIFLVGIKLSVKVAHPTRDKNCFIFSLAQICSIHENTKFVLLVEDNPVFHANTQSNLFVNFEQTYKYQSHFFVICPSVTEYFSTKELISSENKMRLEHAVFIQPFYNVTILNTKLSSE